MTYYLEDKLMSNVEKYCKKHGGHQYPGLYTGEPAFLQRMAGIAPDGPGLEIGVRFGYSIILWGKVREGKGRIIGVELVDRPLMRRNIEDSGLPIEIVIGDSAEVTIPCEELAFLFIDGDHRTEAIKADIKRYVPLVMPRGIVVFHDYKHTKKKYLETYGFGVTKAVRKWHKKMQWERLGRKRHAIAFRRPGR